VIYFKNIFAGLYKNNNSPNDLLLHKSTGYLIRMIIVENNFREFCEKLGSALKKTLPGESSHVKMASRMRLDDMKRHFDLTLSEKSAVLVYFYPFNGSVYFPLILRPAYDGIHAGQISLPGGRMETCDSSLIQTAIREAHEELAIDPDRVQILGKLTDIYIPPSNYLVTPVVGCADYVPEFIPDPFEVAKVIETDIRLLFDKTLVSEKTIFVREMSILAPCFDFYGQTVWGATAMILSELKDIIESIEA
jgi:8-oxo-dGTP pyrophosphatase MutT (NUDIX family)